MVREILVSDSHDVYFNLAMEEYIIRNFDFTHRELLLIYRNQDAIVLGKNQNVYQEVYLPLLLGNNIDIARRISGGGTVVHDMGNINFAFFEKHDIKKVNNYESSIGFMVALLNSLHIECYQNERNAILLANQKKISGSAQFSSSKSILSHISVLFSSNLEDIQNLLKPNLYSIHTKASPSVRSTIDNISNHTHFTLLEFLDAVSKKWGANEHIALADSDRLDIEKLKIEKYGCKEFIFDTGCSGSLTKNEIEINFEKGRISGISGIENTEYYLGKRLLYEEIPSDNNIWNTLMDR